MDTFICLPLLEEPQCRIYLTCLRGTLYPTRCLFDTRFIRLDCNIPGIVAWLLYPLKNNLGSEVHWKIGGSPIAGTVTMSPAACSAPETSPRNLGWPTCSAEGRPCLTCTQVGTMTLGEGDLCAVPGGEITQSLWEFNVVMIQMVGTGIRMLFKSYSSHSTSPIEAICQQKIIKALVSMLYMGWKIIFCILI